jgi:transposase
MSRPSDTEFSSYYNGYVSLVPDGDIVTTLETQLVDSIAYFVSIPKDHETFRYAPEKWSIREVLGHLIDAERVFAYRAFTFSRSEGAALPGFDEGSFIARSGYAGTPLRDLLSEFEHIRRSSILMYQALPTDAWLRRGVANNNEVTVRALAWITAGHERHHRAVLKSRYTF